MTITQNVEWLHNRLIQEKVYKTANTQEFLSMGKGEYYGECDKYFFKELVYLGRRSEIRLHKKSNRVTISTKFTSK